MHHFFATFCLTPIKNGDWKIYRQCNKPKNNIIKDKKINVIENIKIIKTEEITKKELKELLELERSLSFVATKNRFLGRPNNFREIAREKIYEMETLKREIKRLKIETIKLESSKLLTDLNMEKGVEIEEIKEIETTLRKLKYQKQWLIQLKNKLFLWSICITF